MDPALENIGWTEEQLNRICTTVTEEAQRARVAAQGLPVSGPENASTIAVPTFRLYPQANAIPPPIARLAVDSRPNLPITTIAINVEVRTHEAADPALNAVLGMFRRAANHIARIEDALIFNGRPFPDVPPWGTGGLPNVFTVQGDGRAPGLFTLPRRPYWLRRPPPPRGPRLVSLIQRAVSDLEGRGQLGPFACFLGRALFADAHNPTGSLVLPRDRFLPFLQGPLLRSSAILPGWGAIVALSGSPIEILVASEIGVRFLQTTTEPRYVFRVSERIALRIKERRAVALLRRS
jgi:uncharacterized linocin/CFP29 family protein